MITNKPVSAPMNEAAEIDLVQETISKDAIEAIMPDLLRQLSMNGRDPDTYQSRQDDSRNFEISSNLNYGARRSVFQSP